MRSWFLAVVFSLCGIIAVHGLCNETAVWDSEKDRSSWRNPNHWSLSQLPTVGNAVEVHAEASPGPVVVLVWPGEPLQVASLLLSDNPSDSGETRDLVLELADYTELILTGDCESTGCTRSEWVGGSTAWTEPTNWQTQEVPSPYDRVVLGEERTSSNDLGSGTVIVLSAPTSVMTSLTLHDGAVLELSGSPDGGEEDGFALTLLDISYCPEPVNGTCVLRNETHSIRLSTGQTFGDCARNLSIGDSCVMSCDDGYDSDLWNGTSAQVHCIPGETEERPQLMLGNYSCALRHCMRPAHPLHGTYQCPPQFANGTDCGLVCDEGFTTTLPFSAVPRCLNGTVQQRWPNCTALNGTCVLRNSSYTLRLLPGQTFGDCPRNLSVESTCSMGCDIGYNVNGSSTVVSCGVGVVAEHPRLLLPNYTCAVRHCARQQHPRHGIYQCATEFENGTACGVVCDPGYASDDDGALSLPHCVNGAVQGRWPNCTALNGTCVLKNATVSLPLTTGQTYGACSRSLASGESCVMGCDDGYFVDTSNGTTATVRCVSGVNPERPALALANYTCTVRTCSRPAHPANGTYLCASEFGNGTACGVECAAGFAATQPAEVLCHNGVVHGDWPNCTAVRCAPLVSGLTTDGNNVTLYNTTLCGSALPGATCRVNCSAGFRVAGTGATCTGVAVGASQWRLDVNLTCIPRNCVGVPGVTPARGVWACNSTGSPHSELCPIVCRNGFGPAVGTEDPAPRCLYGSYVLASPALQLPTCSAVACGVFAPGEGFVNVNCSANTTTGSACRVGCAVGWEQTGGSGNVVCTGTAHALSRWVHNLQCTPKGCAVPADPERGHYTCGDGGALSFVHNTTCELVCQPTYSITGEVPLCLYGEYVSPLPVCSAPCRARGANGVATAVLCQSAVGSECNASCVAPDFSLSTALGPAIASCLRVNSGLSIWQTNATCVPRGCDAPPTLPAVHGSYHCDNGGANDTRCAVECDAGYQLLGFLPVCRFGAYVPAQATCTESACAALTSANLMASDHRVLGQCGSTSLDLRTGGHCAMGCEVGYTLTSGSGLAECVGVSEGQSEIRFSFQCTPSLCSPLIPTADSGLLNVDCQYGITGDKCVVGCAPASGDSAGYVRSRGNFSATCRGIAQGVSIWDTNLVCAPVGDEPVPPTSTDSGNSLPLVAGAAAATGAGCLCVFILLGLFMLRRQRKQRTTQDRSKIAAATAHAVDVDYETGGVQMASMAFPGIGAMGEELLKLGLSKDEIQELLTHGHTLRVPQVLKWDKDVDTVAKATTAISDSPHNKVEMKAIRASKELRQHYEAVRQEFNRAFLALYLLSSGLFHSAQDHPDHALGALQALASHLEGIGVVLGCVVSATGFARQAYRDKALQRVATIFPGFQDISDASVEFARIVTLRRRLFIFNLTRDQPRPNPKPKNHVREKLVATDVEWLHTLDHQLNTHAHSGHTPGTHSRQVSTNVSRTPSSHHLHGPHHDRKYTEVQCAAIEAVALVVSAVIESQATVRAEHVVEDLVRITLGDEGEKRESAPLFLGSMGLDTGGGGLLVPVVESPSGAAGLAMGLGGGGTDTASIHSTEGVPDGAGEEKKETAQPPKAGNASPRHGLLSLRLQHDRTSTGSAASVASNISTASKDGLMVEEKRHHNRTRTPSPSSATGSVGTHAGNGAGGLLTDPNLIRPLTPASLAEEDERQVRSVVQKEMKDAIDVRIEEVRRDQLTTAEGLRQDFKENNLAVFGVIQSMRDMIGQLRLEVGAMVAFRNNPSNQSYLSPNVNDDNNGHRGSNSKSKSKSQSRSESRHNSMASPPGLAFDAAGAAGTEFADRENVERVAIPEPIRAAENPEPRVGSPELRAMRSIENPETRSPELRLRGAENPELRISSPEFRSRAFENLELRTSHPDFRNVRVPAAEPERRVPPELRNVKSLEVPRLRPRAPGSEPTSPAGNNRSGGQFETGSVGRSSSQKTFAQDGGQTAVSSPQLRERHQRTHSTQSAPGQSGFISGHMSSSRRDDGYDDDEDKDDRTLQPRKTSGGSQRGSPVTHHRTASARSNGSGGSSLHGVGSAKLSDLRTTPPEQRGGGHSRSSSRDRAGGGLGLSLNSHGRSSSRDGQRSDHEGHFSDGL